MFELSVKALISMVLVTIYISGCAEVPLDEGRSQTTAPPAISVHREVDEKLGLTGNTVYIYPVREALEKVINQEHRTEVLKLVKNYLKKRGFVLSDKYAKGYSVVYISGDESKPGMKLNTEAQKFLKDVGYSDVESADVVTETTETTFVNGKAVTKKVAPGSTYHRLVIQWDINQYGQRPKMFFNLTFVSENPLDTVWSDLTKTIQENLDSVKISPPAEPLKMAGDPGCLPRFGFDETRVVDGAKEFFKVTNVHAHSPAQKAGLRVGDIIEAIDSVPYATDWHAKEPTDTYEKKVAVPIKFSRNGQTLRSTIRAEVMCGN